jgi:hypothetical protein
MADHQSTILEEAQKLIYGDRHEAYGPAGESFTRTGKIMGVLLKLDRDLTPQEVAIFFIVHKLNRESYNPKRDNRVDIAGYTALLDDLNEGTFTVEWNSEVKIT